MMTLLEHVVAGAAVVGTGERVPVVASEEDLLDLLVTALDLAGYDVECVGSGPWAVELARTEPFDLLVVDTSVPGLRHIPRWAPQEREVPVLFLASGSQIDLVVSEGDLVATRGSGDVQVSTGLFADNELWRLMAEPHWLEFRDLLAQVPSGQERRAREDLEPQVDRLADILSAWLLALGFRFADTTTGSEFRIVSWRLFDDDATFRT